MSSHKLFSGGGVHPVIDLTEYQAAREAGFSRADAEHLARKVGERKKRTAKLKLFDGYTPHPKQVKLHSCGKRFVIVVAGRRSGKTYGAGREFVRRIFRDLKRWREAGNSWRKPPKLGPEAKPALLYWCVAPTYQLGNLQRREIFEVLGGVTSPLILKYDRNQNMLWLRNGVLIEFRSADRPKFLVGTGLAGVWADEAARLKPEAWADNIHPTLAEHEGWALVTTTPIGKNWLYDELWQLTQLGTDPGRRDTDYHGLHFRTVDNIRMPALIREAKSARTRLPMAVYLRNYEASFDAFEGKIFEDFRDNDTHVVSGIPWRSLQRRISGVDWGFNNPGTQLEIGVDGDGRFWVYREDYQRGLGIMPPTRNTNADCWVNRFNSAKARGVECWWGDPSEPEHIEQCQGEGINMMPANNSVSAGIEALATMLKPVAPKGQAEAHAEPGLFIHRGCSNLRRELSGYRWDNGDDEKPVKEDDHTVDALRYAVFSEHRKGPGVSRLAWSMFDGPNTEAA